MSYSMTRSNAITITASTDAEYTTAKTWFENNATEVGARGFDVTFDDAAKTIAYEITETDSDYVNDWEVDL